MAETFPSNLTPDYIQLTLPEYEKNVQTFDTSDFYQINYQTNQIGYQLNCSYKRISKTDSDTITAFYNLVKHEIFELPADFLAKFPTSFINVLSAYTFWEFTNNVKIVPTIVNSNYFLSECNFTLTNCLS